MNRPNEPYIPVSRGDIVVIETFSSEEQITCEVLEIQQRYGRSNPLLIVKLVTGEKHDYDNGWVTKIVKRYNGPTHPPYNCFREYEKYNDLLKTGKKTLSADN